MSSSLPPRDVPKVKSKLIDWLNDWQFSRFVTLTFNANAPQSRNKIPNTDQVRRTLRKWDAFMNHELIGRYWSERHADRMFNVYFPEKLDSNPHWHGLIRFMDAPGHSVSDQQLDFDTHANRLWTKLVPAGSVDVQTVRWQEGAAKYATKAIEDGVIYELFIVPDEFVRG